MQKRLAAAQQPLQRAALLMLLLPIFLCSAATGAAALPGPAPWTVQQLSLSKSGAPLVLQTAPGAPGGEDQKQQLLGDAEAWHEHQLDTRASTVSAPLVLLQNGTLLVRGVSVLTTAASSLPAQASLASVVAAALGAADAGGPSSSELVALELEDSELVFADPASAPECLAMDPGSGSSRGSSSSNSGSSTVGSLIAAAASSGGATRVYAEPGRRLQSVTVEQHTSEGVLPSGRVLRLSLRRVRFSCAALACNSTAVASYSVAVTSDLGLLDGSLRSQAQAALGCAAPYTLELGPASGLVTVDLSLWPSRGVRPAGNLTVRPADPSDGLVTVTDRSGDGLVTVDVQNRAAAWDLRVSSVFMVWERVRVMNSALFRPPFHSVLFQLHLETDRFKRARIELRGCEFVVTLHEFRAVRFIAGRLMAQPQVANVPAQLFWTCRIASSNFSDPAFRVVESEMGGIRLLNSTYTWTWPTAPLVPNAYPEGLASMEWFAAYWQSSALAVVHTASSHAELRAAADPGSWTNETRLYAAAIRPLFSEDPARVVLLSTNLTLNRTDWPPAGAPIATKDLLLFALVGYPKKATLDLGMGALVGSTASQAFFTPGDINPKFLTFLIRNLRVAGLGYTPLDVQNITAAVSSPATLRQALPPTLVREALQSSLVSLFRSSSDKVLMSAVNVTAEVPPTEALFLARCLDLRERSLPSSGSGPVIVVANTPFSVACFVLSSTSLQIDSGPGCNICTGGGLLGWDLKDNPYHGHASIRAPRPRPTLLEHGIDGPIYAML